jgi:hypothetical protein
VLRHTKIERTAWYLAIKNHDAIDIVEMIDLRSRTQYSD